MKKRGRPFKPEGERMVKIGLRLLPDTLDYFKESPNPSIHMREVLEHYVQAARRVEEQSG